MQHNLLAWQAEAYLGLSAGIVGVLVTGVVVINSQFVEPLDAVWRKVRTRQPCPFLGRGPIWSSGLWQMPTHNATARGMQTLI